MSRRSRPVFFSGSASLPPKRHRTDGKRPSASNVTATTIHYERLSSGRLGGRRRTTTIEVEGDGTDGMNSDWVTDVEQSVAVPEVLTTGGVEAAPHVYRDIDFHDNGPEPEPEFHNTDVPTPNQPKRRVRKRRTNKTRVLELKPLFDDLLHEFTRRDGRGDALEWPNCFVCESTAGVIKCIDCFAPRLYCRACAVKQHRFLPFHRISEWKSHSFEALELRDIGVVINLGHGGDPCPVPHVNRSKFVIFHTNGVHNATISYCDCSASKTGDLSHCGNHVRFMQLVRAGIFPASADRPQTGFTLSSLEMFHKLTLQGKLTMFDYHEALIRLTDNTGALEGLRRHNDLSVVMRVYKHLKMLKRAGRGYDPQGIGATAPGALAVECPACPHPGRNMPEDIRLVPELERWKFRQTLSVDANFRLKNKDRKFDDIDLAPGWAYFVEYNKYINLINTVVEVNEKNQCRSHHSAIASANLRNVQGYLASGTGIVVCGRHALVRRNGVGDLQKGEKYVNMDYIVLSTLKQTKVDDLLITYYIACQWSKKFVERMRAFPEEFHFDSDQLSVIHTIPKFHLPAHGPECQTRYSLNFLPNVARTYGEGVESIWSMFNQLATSTREMAPGLRRQTLDDQWGGGNWDKRTGMGRLFLKNFREAVKMYRIQAKSYEEFTATFPAETVELWQRAVDLWNEDMSSPDPYMDTTREHSVNTVRARLAEEDARDTTKGIFPQLEVSANIFIQSGIELEDQQRVLRVQVANSRRDLVSITADIQEARNVLRTRINAFRTHQDIYMPLVVGIRNDDLSDPAIDGSGTLSVQPENLQLWLPSSLPPSLRVGQDITCLIDLERQYREGQLEDSICEIRKQRRVLQGLYAYKVTNVSGSGQRANTRMRSLIARVGAKVNRAAQRYRVARQAMEVLDKDGSWVSRYLVLRDADISGPAREQDGNTGQASVGEGQYELSWIWRMPPLRAELSGAEALNDDVRVEWARTKARMERWREEIILMLEEMRRTLAFSQWQSQWWILRAENVQHASNSVLDGLRGYAYKVSNVHLSIALRFADMWFAFLMSEEALLRSLAASGFEELIIAIKNVQGEMETVINTLEPDALPDSDDEYENEEAGGEVLGRVVELDGVNTERRLEQPDDEDDIFIPFDMY